MPRNHRLEKPRKWKQLTSQSYPTGVQILAGIKCNAIIFSAETRLCHKESCFKVTCLVDVTVTLQKTFQQPYIHSKVD